MTRPSVFLPLRRTPASRAPGAFEFEGVWQPREYFRLQAAVGHADVKFTRVAPTVVGAVAGGRPQLTPDWTVALSPEVILPVRRGGSFSARLNLQLSLRHVRRGGQPAVEPDQGPEPLLGFNLGYQPPGARWRVTLYGKNVLNEIYDTASGTFGNPYAMTVRNNDRSEFGIKVSYSLKP